MTWHNFEEILCIQDWRDSPNSLRCRVDGCHSAELTVCSSYVLRMTSLQRNNLKVLTIIIQIIIIMICLQVVDQLYCSEPVVPHPHFLLLRNEQEFEKDTFDLGKRYSAGVQKLKSNVEFWNKFNGVRRNWYTTYMVLIIIDYRMVPSAI